MDAFKDAIMAYSIYYPVVEVLSSLAIAAIIWFGGSQVLRGAVTIGILTAFMQYAQRFFRPIMDLSEKYNILQGAMASSERIFKLLDTPSAITTPPSPQKPLGPGRIEFDHVWFAYRNVPLKAAENGTPVEVARAHASKAGEPDWVPCHASFTIEPGETLATVGHTGARNTRTLSLLVRFSDVQPGAVAVAAQSVLEVGVD